MQTAAGDRVSDMSPRKSPYRQPTEVRELTATTIEIIPPAERLLAPATFWAAGDLGLLSPALKRVAVVGSRDATAVALKRAQKLARQLCEAGVVVVSGLAKGIDRAAHDAALACHGRTIAVIGTPLDRCYPIEHADLQRELYTRHLVVSQFPAGARTYPSDFVKRNRFMALLIDASIIVEAGDTSGTLSQAAEVQRLGRPLFMMKSVMENKALTWPDKFLHPKVGRPAALLEDVAQILAAI